MTAGFLPSLTLGASDPVAHVVNPRAKPLPLGTRACWRT